MAAAARASWSSSGPPGCATTSARCAGRWRSRRWCFGDGTDADVVALRRGRRSRPRSRCSTSAAAGSAASAAGWSSKVEDADHRRPGRALLHPVLRRGAGRRRQRRRPARDPGAGAAGRTPTSLGRLADACAGAAGSRLRVPQRGDKRALLETVARNAAQALTQHKLQRAGDLTARGRRRSTRLQEALGLASRAAADRVLRRLPRAGHRRGRLAWWCSRTGWRARASTGGSRSASAAADDVGCDRRGGPAAGSRRYLDERVAAGDAGVDDVDGRRRTADARPGIDPDDRPAAPVRLPAATCSWSTAARRRSPRPRAVLAELGIDDVAVVRPGQAAGGGVAARRAGPGDPAAHQSEALYLLQRVRDEAHRFAITYHRQKRSKAMTTSALDDVPGLGETRRKALLAHFGSLKRLRGRDRRRRSPRCPGIGRTTAEAIVAALAADRDQRPAPPDRERHDRGESLDDGHRWRRDPDAECSELTVSDAPPDGPHQTGDERARSTPWSSPACPAPAAAPPPSAWRTSAASSSTTCRPR